jgi:galactonate dehydratase
LKITEVKLFIVGQPHAVGWGSGQAHNRVLVKIYTDEGITGLGEAFHSLEDPIEGAVRKFRRWLLGQDPTRIIYNWQAIYRGMRYPLGTATLAALSALEQALWDIAGKTCGLPVYKMLGGPSRDRIRVYASPGVWAHDPELQGLSLPEQARAVVARGWTALKFGPQAVTYAMEIGSWVWREVPKSPAQELQESIELVGAVREAVGPDVDLCLDYHGKSFSPADGMRLARAIEPLFPFFLEEPALTENVAALLQVKEQTAIPIAGGERLVHREATKQVIDQRAVDILQLEPTACGGILETVKRAAVAECEHIQLAPHHACGPVSLCACAQIDAVVPNFLIQEANVDLQSDSNRELFAPLPTIENGYLELPQGPGLGIEFNEEAAQKYPPTTWDRPIIVKPDGSIGLE